MRQRDVEEVVRDDPQARRVLEPALDVQERRLQLGRRDDHPRVDERVCIVGQLAPERLERLVAPEEGLPRVLEAREDLAGYAREM
jgi:hypothetical protein